ncbi:MAG: Hpt domain-containing protein [Pedobacter sp.]
MLDNREIPTEFKQLGDGEVVLPDDVPGISIAIGLKRVSGNRELYRELLTMFLNTKRETGHDLRAGLKQADTETAERIAHSIKSIAAVIGAEELSNAAAALEKAIAAGERNRWENTLESFEQCLGVVIAGLEASLGLVAEQEAPVRELPINLEVVQGIVEEMVGLLNSDIGRAMYLRDELCRHLDGSSLALEYRRLKRYLDVFDIDATKESLDELATALRTAGEGKNG